MEEDQIDAGRIIDRSVPEIAPAQDANIGAEGASASESGTQVPARNPEGESSSPEAREEENSASEEVAKEKKKGGSKGKIILLIVLILLLAGSVIYAKIILGRANPVKGLEKSSEVGKVEEGKGTPSAGIPSGTAESPSLSKGVDDTSIEGDLESVVLGDETSGFEDIETDLSQL